jgi:hypothetical protein
MNAGCQEKNNTSMIATNKETRIFHFVSFRKPLIPNPPAPISSHDKASQTLKPVNNIPNPTKNPRYATTCTPTRGKSAGV